jgi:hypothetical protein
LASSSKCCTAQAINTERKRKKRGKKRPEESQIDYSPVQINRRLRTDNLPDATAMASN